MSTPKLFNKLLALNLIRECDDPRCNKRLIIHFFSIVGIIFLFLFGIYSALTSSFLLSLIDLIAGGGVLINLIALSIHRKWDIGGIILLILTGAHFLYLFASGIPSMTGHIWILMFPVIALCIMDLKKGIIASSIYLVAIIGILLLAPRTEWLTNYSTLLTIRIVAAYLTISLLLSIYQYIQNVSKQLQREKIKQSEKENRTIEEFISDISHQIRIPINNIMVVSNLFNQAELSNQQRDLVNTIISSTNNLVNVVNRLGEYSYIELTDQKQENVRLNIYATIENILNLYNEDSQVKLEFDFSRELNTEVWGDPVRIKQIFLNIIENLLQNKYDKENIYIYLTTEIQKNTKNLLSVRFYITTNRILKTSDHHKMPKYYLQDIAAKNDKSLDFTIAREIIQIYGNEQLNIHPYQDKTHLIFKLNFEKVAEAKESKEIKGEEAHPAYTPQQPSPKKEKVDVKDANVLLVEDNMINQKIVNLSLQKAVHNIDIANNGKEALDMFGKTKYDIILMDIKMPVMDGITATKKIRELETTSQSHTPIIAITANALAGDREKCIAAGMNDYISKPFQIEDLIEKMRGVLEA